MYTVLQYGHMIADRVRMEAYTEALRRAVRPGHRVLDVGTGTGIFALLACQLGAREVVAVEPAPAIEAARALAAANGCEGRIRFVRAPVEALEMEGRADVVVSDLRGALPYTGRHLPTMRQVRERFLAPGGVLLPRRDRVFAVPLEAPELYRTHVTDWTENPWSLDLGPARELVVNTLWSGTGAGEGALAAPALLGEVDYAAGPEPDLRARVAFPVERSGTAHALLLWFDAEIAEGVGFSNAPGGPDLVYGRVALPLRRPVTVEEGGRLELDLSALLQGDDYVWSWRTVVRDADGTPRADLRQSTFLGVPLGGDALRGRDLDRRPALGEAGRVDRFALCLADGRRRLEEIARATAERFPGRFRDLREASAHVGALLDRYAPPGAAPASPRTDAPPPAPRRRRRASAAPVRLA